MSQNRKFERLKERGQLAAIKLAKNAYWRIARSDNQTVLWIFGAQRSGTTLLGRIFLRDLRSLVLQEDSILTGSGQNRLRLKRFEEVSSILEQKPFPLVVVKPLVESQRALDLLRFFPSSRGVWMYRAYADVINSHVRRFGSQIRFLEAIISARDDAWMAERVSDESRKLAERFYSPSMKRVDAAALIWLLRNQVFFDQCLGEEKQIALIRYEDLVRNTDPVMNFLYDHLGLEAPRRRVSGVVDARSLGRGENVDINPEIETLCVEMLQRLENTGNPHSKACR